VKLAVGVLITVGKITQRLAYDLLASSSSTDTLPPPAMTKFQCDCPGKDSTISSLLQARRYEFNVERAVYLTVLVLGSRARWFESVPTQRIQPRSNQGTLS